MMRAIRRHLLAWMVTAAGCAAALQILTPMLADLALGAFMVALVAIAARLERG